jgi:hypothetical protein
MISCIYYRTNGGSYGQSLEWGTWDPQPGDLIISFGTDSVPTISSGANLLRSYSLSRFGYWSSYTFQAYVYQVEQSGIPKPNVTEYCALNLWRPEAPSLYFPQDYVFYDNVPRGQPCSFPTNGGVWICVPGNTSWDAEWSWYPVVTGNVTLVHNARAHDVFLIAGESTQGTIQVRAELLTKVDIVAFEVRVEPFAFGFGDFVMV